MFGHFSTLCIEGFKESPSVVQNGYSLQIKEFCFFDYTIRARAGAVDCVSERVRNGGRNVTDLLSF